MLVVTKLLVRCFGFFWRSLQQEEMTKGSAVMILLLSTNLAWCATDVRAEC